MTQHSSSEHSIEVYRYWLNVVLLALILISSMDILLNV